MEVEERRKLQNTTIEILAFDVQRIDNLILFSKES